MEMAGHDIEGQIVRHLCDNPACFRYDHLAIGTQADNLADMAAKGRGRNQRTNVTHCKHGHEFTPDNTYVYERDGRVARQCRACHCLSEQKRRKQ